MQKRGITTRRVQTSTLTKLTRGLFLATVTILGSASISDAKLSGIEYTTLNIGGTEVECPVGNVTRKNELYMIKRALAGDEIAREMVMDGKDEILYYCGDDEQKTWVHITPVTAFTSKPEGC